MSFGLNMGMTLGGLSGVLPVWTPSNLFQASEQGAWYDPSDLSTLFQDDAGTTPVTADGDPVGLMQDKSGNGNHATQATTAKRPTYRRGDSRGFVNALTWSEDFSKSVWVKSNVSVTSDDIAAPIGGGLADKIVGTGNNPFMRVNNLPGDGTSQTVSVYARAAELDFIRLTNVDAGTNAVWFDVSSGTVGTQVGGTGAIEDAGGGWYRCSANFPNFQTNTTADVAVCVTDSDGTTSGYTGNGTDGVHIYGAQQEAGSVTTAYQRNDSHTGGVETGSASDLHWLEFDGVDDALKISNAFTSDMDVTLGLKRADVSKGILIHGDYVNSDWAGVIHSGSGAAPHGATAGTPAYRVNGNAVSPVTRNQLHLDIPTAVAKVAEIDGVDTSTWVTVTFGDYDAYELSGAMYGIVLREAMSASESTDAREYVAGKSGVTL